MSYKVLANDYRPPLQGGEPLWDGATLPYTLPAVALDASDRDCAPGYHYCDSPAGALWEARDAWDARAARDAWDARAAWEARAAWAARAARAAWDALTWRYAAHMGWVDGDPAHLTTGRIDAYRYGAATILPTGPNELGYAMAEEAGDAAD